MEGDTPAQAVPAVVAPAPIAPLVTEVPAVTSMTKVKRNLIAPTLAVITVLGVFGLFLIYSYTDCKAPKEVTFFILGAASSWVTTILTYYFGSSHGSDKKSDLMAQMNQTQEQNRHLEVVTQ